MSTQGALSSLSSSSTFWQSFGKCFADLVSAAWQWMGVCLLSDDRELEKGNSNSLQLVRAKEDSRFAIIVLLINCMHPLHYLLGQLQLTHS